jgi:glycosyltransferase involved in cell wall biosynthesis
MISVIIPTWNRANKIKKAIKSVQNQTYKDLEILVCDDGSNDNTKEIIKELQKKDQRIKWISGIHSGKPATPRNRGIRKIQGEWIAFLDSDDEWLPKKLEKQLRIMKKTNLKASSTNAFRFIPFKKEKKIYNTFKKQKISFTDLIKRNEIITSSVFLHKTLFKNDYYFPENKFLKIGENYFLWLKIATQTDFAYLEEPLLTYIDDPKNSVRGLSSENDLIKRRRILFYFFVWSIKNKIKINYLILTLKELFINYFNITKFNLKKIIKRK